ncbi:histidine kinase [Nonomuraea sp. NPDC049725]|uniref:sensor histidine kinase n=1 Tax=Nonomuraea sp. NPDC049725 TaxID=3154508 RepID=UPI003422F03C
MPDLPIDEDAGLGRFRRGTWWSVTATTGFFLVFVAGAWVLDPAVALWARVTGAAALAATGLSGMALLTRRMTPSPETPAPPPPDAPSPASVPSVVRLPVGWTVAGGAGAAVLGGLMLAHGDDGRWSLPAALVVSIAATFLRPAPRWGLIGAAALAASGVGALSGAPLPGAAVLPPAVVLVTAWTTLAMLWGWDVAKRLNDVRRLAAELAVKEERLRFAADLHDIQGHHLQVIALKSELAARLAEADPARAAAEMHEVRRLAADALSDTRAVVQGYRRTTLDAEIANATGVLAAAGIDARMSVEPADARRLPEAGRHLLGLVMREATTNVLRHSRARHAEVDYRVTGDLARLRVTNDGAGGQPSDQHSDQPSAGGTGLRTLAERLASAGGELTWDHDDDRFAVVARLPARSAEDR